MRQEVLRCAAICFFGNDHLRSESDERLVEVHFKSCFKGVESLDFVRPQAHKLSAPGQGFSTNSKTWFRRLKMDGVEELRLYLPLSIFEPLPAAYGVVVDSDHGSEIFVPSVSSNRRHCELAATKIALWSIPPTPKISEAMSGHLQALTAMKVALPPNETALGQIAEGLIKAASQKSLVTVGCEDLIPASFSRDQRVAVAAAFRTVISLTVPELDLSRYSLAHREIDAVWKSGLQLLEAVNAAKPITLAASA